jgi:hypothetical protein
MIDHVSEAKALGATSALFAPEFSDHIYYMNGLTEVASWHPVWPDQLITMNAGRQWSELIASQYRRREL